MKDTATRFVTVRLTDASFQAFSTKADRFGGKSEVMREMIDGFIEDRLTIQPPATPRKENLYVTGK
jgi:hypothetical protein